jgi:hypothetical protein
MLKWILSFLILDCVLFAVGSTYVKRRNEPLEYTFLIYDKSQYKQDIYKDLRGSVLLKLVSVENNTPSLIWEKKLVENIRLYDLPEKKNALLRKFNIGYTAPNSYFVYQITFQDKHGTLSRDNAAWVDKNKPRLYIGL